MRFRGDLCLDFSVFSLDKGIRGIATSMQSSQDLERFFLPALDHKPTRGLLREDISEHETLIHTNTDLWEQEDETGQRNSGRDLETKRESPLENRALVVLLQFVGDNRGNQGADTETKLLKSR